MHPNRSYTSMWACYFAQHFLWLLPATFTNIISKAALSRTHPHGTES